MAQSGFFELLAGTVLASGDVLAFVDVSDSTQAPQGSLLKMTVANWYAGAVPTTITGGTVTVSTPVLQATQTWNDAAVTFTAIDLNITSTASAAASLLANLRVGGTSQWKVTKAGAVTQTGALTIVGAFSGATTIAASTSVTVTSASAVALAVGLAGATNPAFAVDSSTASQVAGLKLTGAATGGTVALVVTDSGAAANLTINALGIGTIGIGSVSTGRVTITPVTTITGALTLSSTVNSQTISSSANLTGTLTVASNITQTAGTAALQAATATTVTTSGVVGIGGAVAVGNAIKVQGTILSGATQIGLNQSVTFASDATSAYGAYINVRTVAAAFTVTDAYGVYVESPSKGAASAITNSYAIYVAAQTAGATLNYALYTTSGRVHFGGLPTSSAGLASGDIWANSNVLTVVP